MRILIDVLHPAHVHVFRHFVADMTTRGHQVLVASRIKDVTCDLLDAYGIEHVVCGKAARGWAGFGKELLARSARLTGLARRFRPHVVTGCMGPVAASVGAVLKIPSVVFYNNESARVANRIAQPLATVYVTSSSYRGRVRGRHVTHESYHELAYLHPDRFRPDPAVLSEVGLSPGERFALVRFVALESTHDSGVRGFRDRHAFVANLARALPVVVSSEGPLPAALEPRRLRCPPDRLHHVLAHAAVCVGESATLAAEAAVLGVPAVYVADSPRGYLMELEERFGLVQNRSSAEDIEIAVQRALTRPEVHRDHRNHLLAERGPHDLDGRLLRAHRLEREHGADKQGYTSLSELKPIDALNAETPLSALSETTVAPELFYRRSHFEPPRLHGDEWRLEVGGAVKTPLRLSLRDLQSLPTETRVVTLECAGNGRLHMSPVPAGTAWDLGAVSTAVFEGAPLFVVLERAGVDSRAVEVAFAGADRGVSKRGVEEPFERSLPITEATEPGPFLAWSMHGGPLPLAHGFPLRLVVPGWYGMASVKWLERITVLLEPFDGFFQTTDYMYADTGAPVSRARVRAVIASPAAGQRVPPGAISVRGTAWTGSGAISEVSVSFDGGRSWNRADLGPAAVPFAATTWKISWNAPPGTHELVARAQDDAGNVQPLESVWNELGYGNNAVQRLQIDVGPE